MGIKQVGGNAKYLHAAVVFNVQGRELVKILKNVDGVLPVHLNLDIGINVSRIVVCVLISRYRRNRCYQQRSGGLPIEGPHLALLGGQLNKNNEVGRKKKANRRGLGIAVLIISSYIYLQFLSLSKNSRSVGE